MPRSKRNLIVAGALVLSVLLAELLLNLLWPPLARVQVVNEGVTAIEDLSVSYGRNEATIPSLGPGESAHLSFVGWRRRDLTFKFRQPDNALNAFEIADFDPAALSRDGHKLVVTVRPGNFERGQEDDAAPSPRGRVFEVIGQWLERAIKLP